MRETYRKRYPPTGWLGIREERNALTRLYERGLVEDYNDDHLLDLLFNSRTLERRPFTWDLERSLHAEGKLPYSLIPTHTQDTGNCVAASLAQTAMKMHAIELSLGRQEEIFREWYVPWLYAIARNQVGGGISGDGATGAWGAEAVHDYGVLFVDDEGVPPYAGYSDRWGNKRNVRSPEYAKFFPVAADNKVQIVRLTTVGQIIDCLEAGKLCTIASTRGFRMDPKLVDGWQVFVPEGTWYHQMHLTDVLYAPFHAIRRQNQWGPDAHGKPLNGETPGGAWNLAEDLERELRDRDCEVYAYWDFSGEQGEPDPGIL